MKTKLQLAALLCASTFILHPSAFGQGALTPPVGAPAPVMKSLDQIEARTPITNRTSTFTITQPGSYYLTGNLTVSTGDGISIMTNDVTLDLNGFTIRSTATSATGKGINLNGSSDVIILNGHIRSGVTNNGSGVFSGPGFISGIESSFSAANAQITKVTVSGCLGHGIFLGTLSSVIESCTVTTVGSIGITGSTIKSCVAYGCGNGGLNGFSVSDSRGEAVSGYGIFANTVQNSFGRSQNSTGISCESAMNSHGISTSSYGLWAVYSATGCRGSSTSGVGMRTDAAMNCTASSSSGAGLYAEVAMNCIGNCSNGTGINATIVNSCRASSYAVTHNINSF